MTPLVFLPEQFLGFLMTTLNSPSNRPFVWQEESIDSSFTVEFPKAPDMSMVLIGAELYRNPEEHDRLVLHFKGHPSNKKTGLISGDPVRFMFSSKKIKETWYGYIRHVEQPNTWQGGNTDIVCVGATYYLKDSNQKIYRDVTADQVVTKIANKHGLATVTQRHPRTRPSVVQAGQSDWQVIRSLAKQTGFALVTDNTTIFFVSANKIYSEKKKSAPYFFYVSAEDDGRAPRELKVLGTIISWNPMISDYAPEAGSRVDRVITAVNTANGIVAQSTHQNTIDGDSVSGVVVPNEGFFLS